MQNINNVQILLQINTLVGVFLQKDAYPANVMDKPKPASTRLALKMLNTIKRYKIL